MVLKYYQVPDIAQLENVHPETVRRWIREGALPVQKRRGFRNASLISEEDYQQFKDKQDLFPKSLKEVLHFHQEQRIQANEVLGLCIGKHYSFHELSDLVNEHSGSPIKTDGKHIVMMFNALEGGEDQWDDKHIVKKGKPMKRAHTLKDSNYVMYQAYIEHSPVDAFSRLETNVYLYVGQFQIISFVENSLEKNVSFVLSPIYQTEIAESFHFSEEEILTRLQLLDKLFEKQKHPYLSLDNSQEMSLLLKELYHNRCQLCEPFCKPEDNSCIEIHDLRNFREVIHQTTDFQASGQYVLTISQQSVVCCANHHRTLHNFKQPFYVDGDRLTNGTDFFLLHLNKHLTK